ncbi:MULTISPECIES: LysR family transcriptional regulator [Micrococcaceae]|uniref:LysR family transcriptional regulator n=1 Tax=unclassified Kocuria TaxID=2649579 RepID=UPI001011A254|nr:MULTISPECIES: LysR family transcriptional regulator [unclassified Kocuria]
MLNLQRLRMLRELHRRGTLAHVAKSMSYTPSAVSQQLSLLEREAGVVLLEHVGRGVRLTAEAENLVRHADEILAQMELAESELAGTHSEVRGTLRIGSFQTAVMTVASAALDILNERHPRLTVEITQREVGEAYEGLMSHEFDVIIGEEYPGLAEPVREGIDRINMIRDPLNLVIPGTGPWARMPRTVRDLEDAPWAMDPSDQPTGQWARGICRSAGFEPKVRFDTRNPLIQAHLVRTGHAVALIPALLSGQYLAGTRLIGLPGDAHRMVYTSIRTGRAGHPAILACRQAFQAAVRGETAPEPELRLTE